MINKSILTASVLGAMAAAAVSSSAYADIVNASTFCKPGFYAGAQGGRSDTFYNTQDVMAQVANNGAETSKNGNYTSKTTSSLTSQHIDDTGAGGRLYAGYQFNPYFAMEAGYTQYAKTSFGAVHTLTTTSSDAPNKPTYQINNYEGELKEHALDLVAKGTIPLQYGFGLYAKAGAAYITSDNAINAVGSTTTIHADGSKTYSANNTNTVYTKTYQAVRPVAGVGINYTIPNTSFSVVADYTRIFSSGGIKDASLGSLGLEYKFA